MISTPKVARTLAALTACVAVALIGSSRAAPREAERFIAAARVALDRGDGIAAEAELHRALDAGAAREAVAAAMGQALLQQGATDKARTWLESGRFAPGEESYGWRMLGRLERIAGNLPAAGQAYDRALRLTPNNGELWVDIARLRYAGGEQIQAVAAADHALTLDPENPRVLEFRGLLIRDQYGLAAALPWFKAGLTRRAEDLPLLGEYAATLGELGRAKAMLKTTRQMLELDPGNAQALYIQAVLAARAGKMDLARSLLGRTGGRMDAVPAAMLLRGVLELEAGNPNLAIDVLYRLVRQQPANASARLLLARAAAVAGDRAQLFSGDFDGGTASPYLLTLQARSEEDFGRRQAAAGLLSRAATPTIELRPIGERGDRIVLASDWAERPGRIGAGVPYIRKLVGNGSLVQAEEIAERLRSANPGSADAQAVAGDVKLLQNDPNGALLRYRIAAKVRLTSDLVARMVLAFDRAGQSQAADDLVANQLANTPLDPRLNRLAARRAVARGDWVQARARMEYLAKVAPRDPVLLVELAAARRRTGDRAGGERAAALAYRLQRGSETATRAYAEAASSQVAAALAAKVAVLDHR